MAAKAIRRGLRAARTAARRAGATARGRPRRGGAAAGATTRASDSTQRGSKAAAGLLAQEREGALGRPRLAVDAVGDERVVDVADREDARADRELVAARPAG
jgi:hypothetical protein